MNTKHKEGFRIELVGPNDTITDVVEPILIPNEMTVADLRGIFDRIRKEVESMPIIPPTPISESA